MKVTLEGAEERVEIGTGDDSTLHFAYALRGPIIPGSVLVRTLRQDAVSQLGALDNPTACELAMHDIARDGQLYGHTFGSTVDYGTGQLAVNWSNAPTAGSLIICCWRRELSRLRGSQVQVQLPDGNTEWVSFGELAKAIALE